MIPACVVRLAFLAADGRVRATLRLCWTRPPSAAEVLREVAGRALHAKRDGLETVIVEASADAAAVLAAAGLSGEFGR